MFKKMMMFAMSLASRGLDSKKIDEKTKQLRVLSCFGHGDIPSCSYLKKSSFGEKHYCGKCGCGDSQRTWLLKDSTEYSKLDYPVLHCPLHMPGFSNYDPNFYDSKNRERKEKIENFDPDQLKYIQITVGSHPLQEQINEEIKKVIDNS